MNPNYGKLVNGAIIYAPSSLRTPAGLILNPKRLSYLQAGWKFLDLQPPADPPPPSPPPNPASASPTLKLPRFSPSQLFNKERCPLDYSLKI